MSNEFSRTEMLLGHEAMDALARAHVAVFGIGGVGAYAAEALARCGVGAITVVDDDRICLTNLNRQLLATHQTVGRKKTELMERRILEINPQCRVTAHECFYTAATAEEFNLTDYHYIVDAIDMVSSKLLLVERSGQAGVPVISCMGAGNRLDPTRLEVADISKTSVDPLARVMRKELRARGIRSLKVVYSREEVRKPDDDGELTCKDHCVCPPGTKRDCKIRRAVPGSISFVPSAAGLILASQVVRDLTGCG